jgi:hypothetical protein
VHEENVNFYDSLSKRGEELYGSKKTSTSTTPSGKRKGRERKDHVMHRCMEKTSTSMTLFQREEKSYIAQRRRRLR